MTISDEELDAMAQRVAATWAGPWESFVEGRDHVSGDSFIRTGHPDHDSPDIYVTLSFWGDGPPRPGRVADQDFIAAARQDVPRLLAEVRRLRARLGPN